MRHAASGVAGALPCLSTQSNLVVQTGREPNGKVFGGIGSV